MQDGLGPITEKEIDVAAEMNAIVACFNLPVADALAEHARRKGVKIFSGTVIYHLMDDLRDEFSLKLPMREDVKVSGSGIVLQVFPLRVRPNKPPITAAGLKCNSGSLKKTDEIQYRVVREGTPVFIGQIETLKHLKEEVEVIEKGKECGLVLKGFTEYKTGDVIEAFTIERVKRVLDDSAARGLGRDVPAEFVPEMRNKPQARPEAPKQIEVVQAKAFFQSQQQSIKPKSAQAQQSA